MFTAGLQLLTCAAELSGLTCPSLGRGLVGGLGATQSCLAAPVCRKVSLLGRCGGGLFLLSAPSRMSTRESSSPTPCLLTCQKTMHVIKPRENGKCTGTGRRSPQPSGACFLERHLPMIRDPGEGWDYSLPSPFSFQTQITNSWPRRAPFLAVPWLSLFLGGAGVGGLGREKMRFRELLATQGPPAWPSAGSASPSTCSSC